MPTLSITKAPTYTLSIQLYARIGGAAVGGVRPLTEIGTGGLYQCEVPTGDYDCQLLGFSVPDGPRFPVRNGVAYEGIPWSIIDATITTPPTIVPPIADSVCRVQLRARRGAIAIEARVIVTCGSTGRSSDSAFADVAFDGKTDAGGLLQVDLPWSSLAGVGKYRFRLLDIDTGDVFHDRTVTVPNLTTALYEALT